MAAQRPICTPLCAQRKPSVQTKKRAAEATLVLPTAGVPRDESAATPGADLAASANKSRVGASHPAISSDNSAFRAAPLVQERRPVLFVSFRFGPGYL